MTTQRHVKLTHDSGEDTISLPTEFSLSSDDVVVRQEGDRLIIEPERTRNREINAALLAWLATQEPLPAGDAMDPVPRNGPIRVISL